MVIDLVSLVVSMGCVSSFWTAFVSGVCGGVFSCFCPLLGMSGEFWLSVLVLVLTFAARSFSATSMT